MNLSLGYSPPQRLLVCSPKMFSQVGKFSAAETGSRIITFRNTHLFSLQTSALGTLCISCLELPSVFYSVVCNKNA